MILPDVAALVPHAAPMVLIDRVISAGEEELCAEVEIRRDSFFCVNGVVGAWLGVEYMAQAVAAHAGYLAKLRGDSVKMGFLLGTRRFESHCDSFPVGAVLRVYVKRLLVADNGVGSYDCEITEKERKLARAALTVFQPDDAKRFIEEGPE